MPSCCECAGNWDSTSKSAPTASAWRRCDWIRAHPAHAEAPALTAAVDGNDPSVVPHPEFPPRRGLFFQRLQVGDHVGDLAGVESKFWHRRMAGDDALGQCLLQAFHGVTLVEGAERRREAEGAVANLVDRVAFGAIRLDENQTPLLRWLQRLRVCRAAKGQERDHGYPRFHRDLPYRACARSRAPH